METSLNNKGLDNPIQQIHKAVGEYTFDFILFKEHKHYFLITSYLYLDKKDNFSIRDFNSQDEAMAFIDDWFKDKKAKIKKNVAQFLRFSFKHNCSVFNKKQYARIDGISKPKGDRSIFKEKELTKPFNDSTLSVIPKKVLLKDILELDDINDIADFLKHHFL